MIDGFPEELPLVSVIVPAYNYGHFIAETLESILAQTHQSWECIVVDNGSTDHTSGIVQTFIKRDPRFSYYSIVHSTTSASRNHGLSKAKGGYIQFVDSDDQIAEGKLKNGLEIFRKYPETSLVYGNARFYDSGESSKLRLSLAKTNTAWMPEFTGLSWDLLPVMFEKNVFVISSPLLKKEIVDRIHGFYSPLNWVEDWDFYFRCLSLNINIRYDGSPNAFSLIRVHSTSLSRNYAMMLEQSLIVRERAEKILLNLPEFKNRGQVIQANKRFIKHIHRTLTHEYSVAFPRKSSGHAFLFAKKDRDFRLLIRAGINWIINKPLSLPQT